MNQGRLGRYAEDVEDAVWRARERSGFGGIEIAQADEDDSVLCRLILEGLGCQIEYLD